jgi:hypothetical protein
MITFAIISILIIAIPVVVLQGFFSYFEAPLSFTGFHQSELISFFFMILKDLNFWNILGFALIIIIGFSILKSWNKYLFYIVLAGILFPFYKLLYFIGYNAPADTFNYQIYSGENCFYDNGFEKYLVLDLSSKNTKLISIDTEDNSFTAGEFIVRDTSSIKCEFTKEKSLLIKN